MSWVRDKVFTNGQDFVNWLNQYYGSYISKCISDFDIHHTWRPDHSAYPRYSTLQLHRNMRNYHINERGWGDMGQHISIGKDGKVVLGRHIASPPASAYGHNGKSSWHPFMVENIGNFDKGNDKLTGKQLASLEAIGHYLCFEKRKDLRFHREMDSSKSCPGTGIDKKWLYNRMKAYAINPEDKGYLIRGDRGKSIVDLQNDLRDLGYYLKADGDFGPKTEKAVRQFQRDHGIDDDGSYGPVTQKTMLKALEGLKKKKARIAKQKKEEDNLKHSGFKDVEASRDGAELLKYAKDQGLVKGTGNDEFQPDKPLTRLEGAMLIARLDQKLTKQMKK